MKFHKYPDISVNHRCPLCGQNGPEIYHSTAAAMRSMRKNVPEAEEAETQKKTTEKKETEEISTKTPFYPAFTYKCYIKNRIRVSVWYGKMT